MEDLPGSLFHFFLGGGLAGALGFSLGFVLFKGPRFVLALGLGLSLVRGHVFGPRWGARGEGGHSRRWPRVAGGERGPGTGGKCCLMMLG